MIGSTNAMGGGGVTSDETTTTRDKVLAGTTYLGADTNDETGIGSMPDRGSWTGSVPMNGSVTIPDGAHKNSKVNGPAVTQRGAWNGSVGKNSNIIIPEGYHNGQGCVNGPLITDRGAWGTTVGRNSRVAIPAGEHNGAGYVEGPSMPDRGAATITPGTVNQVIGANQFLVGTQTILGDANLNAANIAKNKIIFGVRGTFQGYVDVPFNIFVHPSWYNTSAPDFVVITTGSYGYYSKANNNYGGGIGFSVDQHNTRYNSFRSNQQYDFTNYSRLIFKVNDSNATSVKYIGTTSNASINSISHFSSYTSFTTASSSGTLITVDIRSVTGLQYIGLYSAGASTNNSGSSVRIHDIYLE